MKPLKFRAWTGKHMLYQEQQYLGSFIRRVIMQINLDSERGFQQAHEAYLPDGKSIDDYLMLFTGFHDANGKDIYEGDRVEWTIWPDDRNPECTKRVCSTLLFRNGVFATMRIPRLLFELMAPHRKLVVIGNVYETPELLKEMRT